MRQDLHAQEQEDLIKIRACQLGVLAQLHQQACQQDMIITQLSVQLNAQLLDLSFFACAFFTPLEAV